MKNQNSFSSTYPIYDFKVQLDGAETQAQKVAFRAENYLKTRAYTTQGNKINQQFGVISNKIINFLCFTSFSFINRNVYFFSVFCFYYVIQVVTLPRLLVILSQLLSSKSKYMLKEIINITSKMSIYNIQLNNNLLNCNSCFSYIYISGKTETCFIDFAHS